MVEAIILYFKQIYLQISQSRKKAAILVVKKLGILVNVLSFPKYCYLTQYRCYLCCIFGNIYLCSSAVISYEKITPKIYKIRAYNFYHSSPILGKQISVKENLNAFYFKMPPKYGMSSIGL